jgi:hypothetical protein
MRPRVEILCVPGCPNRRPAQALVERVAGELGVETDIELVEVSDADAAAERRFLGSPTVRVDGRDVEPGAERRQHYALSCRLYADEHGVAGKPGAHLVRAALVGAGGRA